MTRDSAPAPAGVSWNYDRAELIADGFVHAIGLCLGLAGAVALGAVAANWTGPLGRAAVAIYVTGLIMMLGLSAAYNLWPISRVKWILRRFDHSAIYLMIAGTYTAVLAQLPNDRIAIWLLAGIWLAAALGITLKLLYPGHFQRLAIVLYLILGWSGVLAFKAILAALPTASIALLATGGALYTAGVVVHTWQGLRFQNALWHGCVVVAAGCHYWAIILCIIPQR